MLHCDELQDGGGEETNMQGGGHEGCQVSLQESDEMQVGDEKNEKVLSQVGVQESAFWERGEVCRDGEATRREKRNEEMFLPP